MDHVEHLPPELIRALRAYLDFLLVRNYSPCTIHSAEHYCLRFIEWADDRSLTGAAEITLPLLESYQRHVYHRRKANGQRLGPIAQHSHLVVLRCWLKWLARHEWIGGDPGRDMVLPRRPKRLPRAILSEQEIETLLCQPDLSTPTGLRDRTIMETFYSTAMRRSELAYLDLADLDLERGTIRIRDGKGQKERMVPVGRRAIGWLESYLATARRVMLQRVSGQVPGVFLTTLGRRLVGSYLSDMVRRYLVASGVAKQGGCHLFRHTAATRMMENGADVRIIQSLLGHGDLNATQIYTHVTINRLREVHRQTHPARDPDAKT